MFKSVLASAAATGLLLAPIAAQAGTQAAESTVSLAPLADRAASPVAGSEQVIGADDLLWLLPLLLTLGITLHESVSTPGIFD